MIYKQIDRSDVCAFNDLMIPVAIGRIQLLCSVSPHGELVKNCTYGSEMVYYLIKIMEYVIQLVSFALLWSFI